jgi:diadenosine tetraphosphate (Ap4A) HIT family hydrolase
MLASKTPKPTISKIWSFANGLASRFYGTAPNALRVSADLFAERVKASPPRDAVSGDFENPPSFVAASTVLNAVARYIGSPKRRAHAWEDLGTLLDRWGWRMSDHAYTQAHTILQAHNLTEEPPHGERLIFESKHFRAMIPHKPLIDRIDGGHVVVYPMRKKLDRMQMTPEESAEYMPFCIALGRAFTEVMNESGIEVERINWMDMGNWRLVPYDDPRMHVHLFGRAKGSRFQIHGEFNHLAPKGSKHYDLIKTLNVQEEARLVERVPKYFEEEAKRAQRPGY